MKNKFMISGILASALALTLTFPVFAINDSNLQAPLSIKACSDCVVFEKNNSDLQIAINNTAKFLYTATHSFQDLTFGHEWVVLGLMQSEYNMSQESIDNYYKNVCKYVKDNKGILSKRKYTEYSRLIIALTAIDKNPADVCGYNLFTKLGDYDKTIAQGMNGAIFALLALDCGDYEIPQNSTTKTQATREMYVDYIMKHRQSDGGFSLSVTGSSDVDITAMALQALSKYRYRDDVLSAVKNAVNYLSKEQNDMGGYQSNGIANLESTAQVIIALSELGISYDDSRFIKSGNILTENLATFQNKDGGFAHIENGSSNKTSTEQALCALASIKRMEVAQSSLYRIATTNIFDDIANSENISEIEYLAKSKMINGVGERLFKPNSTMTRAEFATIIVRALNLETNIGHNNFTDVSSLQWYSQYVNTASYYGIINGYNQTTFAPNDKITREQAMTMISRAMKTISIDTTLSDSQVEEILKQYIDTANVSSYAKSGIAVCLKNGIVNGNSKSINALKGNITREEVAGMVQRLLGK